MASTFEFLLARERLGVAQRFLRVRPKITAVGVAGNALCLSDTSAPLVQKLVLCSLLLSMWVAFVIEAWWLQRRALSESWLFASLALTLSGLAVGMAFSGGVASPVLPLSFAPVVVGFAAFGRTRRSVWLLGIAAVSLLLLKADAPFRAFPELPPPWSARMLLLCSLVSLALLAVGVIGLVDAHTQLAAKLERMRLDMLMEAERRASSVESLGARVAHEVKNPLTAVRGLVQLVARKASDGRDRERLAVVVGEVDRAIDVLTGYLSMARPLVDLSLAEVDLRALLEDVAGVLEARAHERGVRLVVAIHGGSVVADRQRVREALLNLALNAITAMPNGGTLELRATELQGRVCIEVIDDGVGMSSELLARVGEAFVSEAEGGTGLGVLSARSVAHQHGGALTFHSQPGRGTRAVLELPADSHRDAAS